MSEINIRKCKICLQEKQRILHGKYPNKKDKQWVDPTGKLWNGNTCPSCHQAKVAEQLRAKRQKLKV